MTFCDGYSSFQKLCKIGCSLSFRRHIRKRILGVVIAYRLRLVWEPRKWLDLLTLGIFGKIRHV